MKILEVNKFLYLRRGAERHFLDVVDLLRVRGHEVATFGMQHPKNAPGAWSQFEVSYVGYNPGDSTAWQKLIGIGRLFWSFEARRLASELLREFHPEVAHLHNIYHQLSPSILGPIKRAGIPVIMTVHDYALISPDKDVYYESVGRHYWKFLFVKKYSLIKRVLLILKMYWEHWMNFYAMVDHFIAPSEFVKQTLIRGRIPADKIVVIPHLLANEADSVTPATEEGYAIYFGSLSPEKGIAELIRIFTRIQKPLVLAGSCEGRYIVPKNRWVRYLGKLNREELNHAVEGAKCVVSGSRLPETFGLVALEALSLGKPFFGLRTGAFSEIVQNGKYGYLAKDFRELKVVLKQYYSGKIRFSPTEIQKQARERFSKEAFAARFEALAESLTKQG